MTLPPFVSAVGPEAELTIREKLRRIETEFDVRILFAVESGSRAWGFPSPDSDYDVRFVYAHRPDWYLSLTPGRDVIELPIEGDWDINGWDIRKALNLLMKPNPVMLEWLSSPVRYAWSEATCKKLHEFASRTTFGESCAHHYRNLARQQWNKHVGEESEVNYKKYFYILRPALAIHWVRSRPSVMPPMNLQALVEGLQIEAELVDEIAKLLHLKARAKETGLGQRVPVIDQYIHEQIDWASVVVKDERRPDLLAAGDHLFRDIVQGTIE